MPAGRVQRLWRWPVRSMGGEEVGALSVGPHGVGGDRTHALLVEHDYLTDPRLAAWSAAYPFNLDAGLDPAKPPHALVTGPDGRHTWRWGDPRLRSALERDLGRTLELRREVVPGHVRLFTEATHAALERDERRRIDPRRHRSNLQLALDAAAGDELEWLCATVEFARGVRLEIVSACDVGVRARVLSGGRVAEGDAVRVETSGTSGSAGGRR